VIEDHDDQGSQEEHPFELEQKGSGITIPAAGSDKAPVQEAAYERNYAGARIMNPFPERVLLTPSEAVLTINILSGLLMADERFLKVLPEIKKYGAGR
jgi:hypothetical protein